MSSKLVVYLPEDFADWEGAFLFPELVRNKVNFLTVSESGKQVNTIGRMKVIPDAALADISREDMSGLILIGSDTWSDPLQNQKVLALATELLGQGVLVAAICGATVALARTGGLDSRKHTSNDLGMLKAMAPSYQGEKNYVQKLAVRDRNLVTAAGVGPIEFTLEIMRMLEIYSEEKRQQWFALYKSGTVPPIDFWS